MNSTVTSFGAGVLLIALTLVMSGASGSAQPAATGLPGARPEIDASKFPSLQAAFDAIPEGGGLVRLPAGDFEITEPLLLRRGDVRVEGAGSGDHRQRLQP